MATYKIKYGDTLSGIAQKYNTTVNELMNLNPYIENANRIYAGKYLNLPSAKSNTTAKSTSTAKKTTTNSTNTKSTQQLAEEYAKQQTSNVSSENEALLEQYRKIAEQQKQALANKKLQTENQINSQRDTVLQNYNNNSRQAYINKMLASKNVEQELSQRGLNTSGLVASAYANVENSYGNNLANLQTARDNSIKDIDTQLNNAQLEYASMENELLANIASAELELQKYGNELAYQKYQDALNNYLNFVSYDYQKEQDALAQSNWQKEYELAKKNLISSSSSRNSSSTSSGSNSNSKVYKLTSTNKNTNNVAKTTNKKEEKEVDSRAVTLAEKVLQNTVSGSLQRQALLQNFLRTGQISQEEYKILINA